MACDHSYNFASDLKDDIKKLDIRIKELESLKKKENEFEDLEENLFGNIYI